MKQLLIVLIALLVVVVVSNGQTLKQVLPTMTGGTQAKRAAMLKGPHDFTPDSGNYKIVLAPGDTINHAFGTSKSLCSYCHAPHIPVVGGIANPLWARASLVGSGRTWGYYSDPTTIPSGYITDPVATNNYSAFCLGCHDGSVGIFAASAYSAAPYGAPTSDANFVDPDFNVVSGKYDLQHVHPVNFDYNAFATTNPQEFYAPENSGSVWHGDNGSGSQTTVRLFSNYMQCPSCHNPHMNSGIGLVYSSNYGQLCVACHKK